MRIPNSLLPPSQLQLFVEAVNLKLAHPQLSLHMPYIHTHTHTLAPSMSRMLIVACVTCILAHCNPPPAPFWSAWAFPASASASASFQSLYLVVPCGFLIYHIVYTACQKFDLLSPAAGHTWAHLILITHVSRLTHAQR